MYNIRKLGIFTLKKVVGNHLGPKYISSQNDREFMYVKKLSKNPSLLFIESRGQVAHRGQRLDMKTCKEMVPVVQLPLKKEPRSSVSAIPFHSTQFQTLTSDSWMCIFSWLGLSIWNQLWFV